MLGEYKATTVNRKLSALKVFMRWAADLGLVERQAMPRLQHVTNYNFFGVLNLANRRRTKQQLH